MGDMTWHYQVVREHRWVKVGKTRRLVHEYNVYEVYRDKGGGISWTEQPKELQFNESVSGLRFQFARILADLEAYGVAQFQGRGKKRRLVPRKEKS